MNFVELTTREGSPEFIPVAERIAVFDNDGTLWSEQPLYFQALFIFDRIGELADEHPEWETTEPFASVLKGDLESALAGGDFQMLEWTTSGTGPRFAAIVHHDDADREWAYDRDSHIGRLVRGLDEGPGRGWTIISIRNDWNEVFP